MRSFFRVALLPLAVIIGTSCSDAGQLTKGSDPDGQVPLEPTPAPVASVTVSPPTATVGVAATAQLTAVAKDASGNTLSGRAITWSSSNLNVATVSASGLVTAVAAGTTSITALLEGKSASASITVAPAAVASVSLQASSTNLVTGQNVQINATLRDASGATLTGRPVTWMSTNPAVATVSQSGLVTGVGAGTTAITATSEGVNGSLSFQVTLAPVATIQISPSSPSVAAGSSVVLTATARDAAGNVLTGRPITWASSATAVATVANGTVTGVTPGTSTITASAEGITASTVVTVTTVAAPVATVAVNLAASSLTAGQTTQATATLRDASNNVLSGRTITWSSSNTGVATVNSSGVVTAVAAGTTNIVATSEGRSGSASLTVTTPAAAPVASVTVNMSSTTLTVGSTQQASVTLRDASNNVLTGRTVTWSSSNTTVATVSASGLVSALAAGSATITATSESVSGTRAITVTSSNPPPPTGTTEPTLQPSDVVLFRDAFDYSSASQLSGKYALRGVQQIVSGRAGNAVRFPYNSSSYDNLIEFSFSPTTDIYISYSYRLSPGADPTCGGRGGSGMKWFMAWRSGGPRYTNGVGALGPASQANLEFTTHDNSSTQMPNPFMQNISKSPRFGTTNDGQWHRYTIRIVTGNRGYEQLWVDGTLVLDSSPYGYDHAAEGIAMIQLPGTVVSWFSGCDFTIDVDDMMVWRK